MITILLSFVLLGLSIAILCQQEVLLTSIMGVAYPEVQSFLQPYEQLIIVALPIVSLFLLLFSVLQKRNSVSNQTYTVEQDKLKKELSEVRVQVEEVKQINEVLEEEASAVKNKQLEAEDNLEKAREKVKELQGGKLKRDAIVDAELLNFLSLLQEKGRFVDFVMGDISQYPDEKIGAAARVVHQGCKELLTKYFSIAPIMEGQEGQQVTIGPSSNHQEIKVVGGELNGSERQATVMHCGWRATQIKLPRVNEKAVEDSENVIVPAEVNVKK